MDNRFYMINNPSNRQYIFVLLDLTDISSVQYPNESLNVGVITTKTGKEHYIQKDELDNIIKLLNIININTTMFMGKPINTLSDDEKLELIRLYSMFDIYEPDKTYFPGKNE